jgi:hypothetical protein
MTGRITGLHLAGAIFKEAIAFRSFKCKLQAHYHAALS